MSFLKFIDKNFKINPVGVQALIGMGIIRAANNAAALQTNTLDTANSTLESRKDYKQILFGTFLISCRGSNLHLLLNLLNRTSVSQQDPGMAKQQMKRNAIGLSLCFVINPNTMFKFLTGLFAAPSIRVCCTQVGVQEVGSKR